MDCLQIIGDYNIAIGFHLTSLVSIERHSPVESALGEAYLEMWRPGLQQNGAPEDLPQDQSG